MALVAFLEPLTEFEVEFWVNSENFGVGFEVSFEWMTLVSLVFLLLPVTSAKEFLDIVSKTLLILGTEKRDYPIF